ncbi:DUF7255 family protein [Algoriphagus antarcticus]|uniref:Uncharacterized protein n=1 Tax=Algoriphagus antarcticus TaxID=238540 RepID=A0A3E0E7J9_9BACT|nr:hypothetical protein [Algoriphagus antarcticus]REG94228.1 hypothetical protein C8N25_10153 [Algoriphagus antarcticus]
MDNLMTRQLDLILREGEVDFERDFELELEPKYLDQKGHNWLKEIYEDLGGAGKMPLLEKLKFDFKINRNLFVYDDEVHFNRYRLITFKSDLYLELNFPFLETQKRLCRSYEKECLKVGMQQRIWNGAPIAKHSFGEPSEPGDFSGNGGIGWKLLAYNDAQFDLQTRIHGYKLFRITPFETLMTGGSLKRLDQLLINPKEEQRTMLLNWFMRKYQC